MPRKSILVVAALVLGVLACNAPTQFTAEDPGAPKNDDPIAETAPDEPFGEPAEPRAATFEVSACPFDFNEARYTIDCGYLIVPERRSDPASASIELAVAILRSPNPQPDPIVYLAGGPGGSALYEVDIWAASPLLQNRDIILIDQRGTGYSFPTLDCPEEADFDDGAERCFDRLSADGIDIAAYNSAESAADLEDLRQALAITEWNLIGVSYGTRLALTALRDHGAAGGIRSVILDSPYPPEVDAYTEQGINTLTAFEVLFEGCAADPACREAYPNLRETFYTLVADLEQFPVEFTAYDADFDEDVGFTLFGYDLLNEVFLAMYDTTSIPYLPQLIDDVNRGDYALIGDLMLGYSLGPDTVEVAPGFIFPDEDVSDAEGMFYAVECYEEYPFTDLGAALDLMNGYPPAAVDLLYYDIEIFSETCDVWGVAAAGPEEDTPVVSDVPTLIMAGEYDPITPPGWGEVVERGLTADTLVVFPGVGHAAIDAGRCPMQITADFLADPTTPPDTSCIEQMGPPAFVTP